MENLLTVNPVQTFSSLNTRCYTVYHLISFKTLTESLGEILGIVTGNCKPIWKYIYSINATVN